MDNCRMSRRWSEKGGSIADLRPWLLGMALLLFLAAWLFSNPAGAAPDEEAHYIKAAGLSQGQVLGPQIPPVRTPGESQVTWLWFRNVSRSYHLPSRLAPPNFAGCYAFRPDVPAGCTRSLGSEPAGLYSSYTAVYPPTAYLLPALFIRFASNAFAGLLLGRVAMAIVTSALLLLAVASAWRGSSLSLLGLALAVTPMTLFLSAVLSDSAAEVAGGVCFLAALLRVLYDRGKPSLVVQIALAMGGAALAASRPVGPLWVVCDVIVAATMIGPAELYQVAVRSSSGVRAAAVIVVAAMIFAVGWTVAIRAVPATSPRSVLFMLAPALGELPAMLQQAVGVFGWLDTPLPSVAYVVWAVLTGTLVLAALIVGTWRQRIALVVGALLYLVTSTGLTAALMTSSGLGAQGRYYLPVAIAAPMLAAEVALTRRVWTILERFLLACGAAVLAGVQLSAWWQDARRYAVGANSWRLFVFHHVSWSPSLGWWPWIGMAAAGSLCIFAAFFVPALRPAAWPPSRPSPAGRR